MMLRRFVSKPNLSSSESINQDKRKHPLDASNYDIHKQGYLVKSPPFHNGKRGRKFGLITAKYRNRYFVLHTNNQNRKTYFDYFKNHEDLRFPKGTIDLENCKKIEYPSIMENKKRLLLEIETKKGVRNYYLSPLNDKEDEILSWLDFIKKTFNPKD